MVQFYGVMLHMSIEPHRLGGYECCFKPTSHVRVGHGYNLNLFGYVWWAERIMTLSRFRHIISVFHPEAGEYSVGDKCHKLRYLIIIVNDASGNTFYLGPRSAFDEGHITTFRRFCYVRQYNKDKP